MNLIALDTSTDYCSVCLQVDGVDYARDCLAGQRQSELLLPMVRAVLAEAKISLGDLAAIAFGAGPGSFTGLRIACGAAQGLGFGANLPVVPICSLLAMAEASGAERVIAALDARMGEIYHAAYQRGATGWQQIVAPNLCRPEQTPAVEGAGWCAVGSGFAIHAEPLAKRYQGQIERCDEAVFPHARQVARLARQALQQGATMPPEQAAPLYVRNKVALTTRERGAQP